LWKKKKEKMMGMKSLKTPKRGRRNQMKKDNWTRQETRK